MGLTHGSTGKNAVDNGLYIRRRQPDDVVVAVAGNPNVGKSTLFNALTGMHQHTGNWPGKTVSGAQGRFSSTRHNYVLVDIPGAYSLMAHSPEEEVARDFLCFQKPDLCIVVCDAGCLRRSLNLALQIMEVVPNVILCVNLLDEAQLRGIHVNLEALEKQLGVPVAGTVARKKHSLKKLISLMDDAVEHPRKETSPLPCPAALQAAAEQLQKHLPPPQNLPVSPQWLALRLLEGADSLLPACAEYCGWDESVRAHLRDAVAEEKKRLSAEGLSRSRISDLLTATLHEKANAVAAGCVYSLQDGAYSQRDRRLDRLFTGRWTAFPMMLLLLALLFFITISGANMLSDKLAAFLFKGEALLSRLFSWLNAPPFVHDACVFGIYRTLAWVVSVMLPPMAIFFPLFTLLEDSGYLPRIAYNLDRPFEKCCACGKQSLCMAMGLGCNAAGVVGCRIIDSPRERLIAILTNSFIPCNGRLPILLSVLTMFFAGSSGGLMQNFTGALFLTGLLVLAIGMTFAVSKLLSKTLLKGIPSSFTLEMPPYRKPQLGKVILRSIFDRVLFVLGRAAAVAAPAGLVLWLCANVNVQGASILSHLCRFLDAPGRLMGLDGVILTAFLLGFPASEIVLPIALMAYLSGGMLAETGTLLEMREIFVANGWTWLTAVNMLLFTLFHWPCSTTLLTIRKETGSLKWTLLAFLLPTAIGILLCAGFTLAVRLIWPM